MGPFSRSADSQDNRQPGRERSDFTNAFHGFGFGANVGNNLDLNSELSIEGSSNSELNQRDRLYRSSAQINWRMTPRMALSAILTGVLGGSLDESSKTRNGEADLQWSYNLGYDKGEYKKIQGQFFVRYSNRYGRVFDGKFGFGSLTRLQTLNLGLNFVFF